MGVLVSQHEAIDHTSKPRMMPDRKESVPLTSSNTLDTFYATMTALGPTPNPHLMPPMFIIIIIIIICFCYLLINKIT